MLLNLLFQKIGTTNSKKWKNRLVLFIKKEKKNKKTILLYRLSNLHICTNICSWIVCTYLHIFQWKILPENVFPFHIQYLVMSLCNPIKLCYIESNNILYLSVWITENLLHYFSFCFFYLVFPFDFFWRLCTFYIFICMQIYKRQTVKKRNWKCASIETYKLY